MSKLPAGRYYIKSVHNGLYLDAKGGGKTNGTDVIVWNFNGNPNQQWDFEPEGYIRNVNSHLVLDLKGGKGHDLITYQANGGSNQKFSWDGKGHIIIETNHQVLDVKGESKSPGAEVVLWPANGKSNQLWELIRVNK